MRNIIEKHRPNYTPITDTQRVDLWAGWYSGNVVGIHNYNWWNGTNFIPMKLKSLQMAKKVCEDWANLLMNERVEIRLKDDIQTEKLNDILDKADFFVKANEGIELSFALGYGALVLSVDGLEVGENTGHIKKDHTELKIDFVDRFKIEPITVKDKEITEAMFTVVNSDTEHYILHLIEKGQYVIYNYVKEKGKTVELTNIFNTKSKIAWFQILKPNIASNVISRGYDPEVGISVFANSLDTLHSIDNKYDGFDLEFVLGRRRLYVSSEMWKVHNKKDGTQDKTFNPMDALHYILPNDDAGNKVMDVTGNLRANDFINALNMDLSILSSKVGMGENYYRFDFKTGTPTATQIISENSTLYRTLKKHEIRLERSIVNLILAVVEASNNFTVNAIGNVERKDVIVDFDDSIIEDKNAEMTRDENLVSKGLMSAIEYRVKWLGETEEDAIINYKKEFRVDLINKLLNPLISGAISPEEFIEEVYGEEKADLLKYISETIKQSGALDMSELYIGDDISEVIEND